MAHARTIYEPDLAVLPQLNHVAACPTHGLLGIFDRIELANTAFQNHANKYHPETND